MARPDRKTAEARADRKARWTEVREKNAAEQARLKDRAAELAAAPFIGLANPPSLPSAPSTKAPPPTIDEVTEMLRSAFRLAMETFQPGHATNAALALAKVHAFLVERQAIVTGTPDDFRGGSLDDADERAAYAKVREEHGERAELEFRRFMVRVRAVATDGPPLIEHEPDV